MPLSARRQPLFSRAAAIGRVALLAAAFVMALALFASDASAAQAPVNLGTAESFAVLAGQTVTNSGPSTLNGDLGVSPGTAVNGFREPGVVNGTIHAGGAVAAKAQSDLQTAYNDAAGRAPAVPVLSDLGGSTRTAGVYKSYSSLALTGTLTLDARGDPNAVFVFQAASTLTTAPASRVQLLNGAQPCNVFWQVGSSATLGASSVFAGNILAWQSIAMNDRVALYGRALARNGAVTLINDTVTAAHCAAGAPSVGGITGSTRFCATGSQVKRRPARPVLRKPRKNARVRAGAVKFRWRSAARAARYTLIVDHHRMKTGCATRAVMRVSNGSHRYRVLAENRYGARSSHVRMISASTRAASRRTARRRRAARHLRVAGKELRRYVRLVVHGPGDWLRLLFYHLGRSKLSAAIAEAKRAGLPGAAARYQRLLKGQTRRAQRAIRKHKAADPHVKAIIAIIERLGVDAARQSGARTTKEVKRFLRRHRFDIARAARLWGRDHQVNRQGAKLIAQGVKNRGLTNAIKALYRYGARKGDGSTMFALIKEAERGCVRYDCKHFKKAIEHRKQIIKLLSRKDLSPTERRIAGDLVSHLNRAIRRAKGK